ncbi:MAG: enoyl-CoA hydratase-related protein, partial [Alphaproteobacteria bacterium]|nr:enoyl-CoA hydratase-related protein [Alphaproteobacteria bacterium]
TPSLMVPFLIGRIGQRGCRRWCLTGETLSAAEALRIGLVDRVAADDELDAAIDQTVDYLLKAAPGGLATSKVSIADNARPRIDAAATERALAAFVEGRASPQAAEGSAAFMEKRPPDWAREVDG